MSFGKILGSSGFAESNSLDIGNVLAGSSGAKKFFVQNNMSRVSNAITGAISQYGTNDMYSRLQWALCPDTLSCPYNVTATVAAGGSLVADTTYYFRITAYNDLGETTGSIEVSGLTTSANKTINLAWDAIAGAAGYMIYRSTTSESYDSSRRMVIEDGATVTFSDSGQDFDPSGPYNYFPGINSDFNLPAENTTAGDGPGYGTAPALATGDISVGALGIGQMQAIWIGSYPSVATPEGYGYATIDFTEAA